MKFILVLFLCALTHSFFAQKVGEKVNVIWNGTWYKSTILEIKNGKFKVHYDGWGSEWDEWVTSDRIKVWSFKVGEKVQVLSNGIWYKASILQSGNDGTYKVHYDGWGVEFDEWVPIDRIKK